MATHLRSPYVDTTLPQRRGNLHTHTTLSDGPLPPQATVDAYAALGYDFLMLSDHDGVTDVAALDGRGMTLLPGNEITAGGVHVLHVNAQTVVAPCPERQCVVDDINEAGGFAIMNHPNWGENFIHCPQVELERIQGYTGIEIFNGVSDRVEGSAFATDRWDMLLSRGRVVWGFGNDDGHDPIDFGLGWNVVFAGDSGADTLINAMAHGNFYVSTGVRIDALRVSEQCLEIDSEDTECFRIVTDHGCVRATVEGNRLRFALPERPGCTYLRVECLGRGARMAWTQPFFVAAAPC